MKFFEFAYDQIMGGLILEIAIPIIIVLAVVTRWDIGLNQACLTVGRKLANESTGTGFQDAITPPWRANIFLVLWGLTLVVLITCFLRFGFLIGIGLVFFVVVSIVVGAAFVPKAESRHYLGIILYSLINRRADYRRDGDADREEAASILVTRLMEEYEQEMLAPKKPGQR